MQDFLHFKSSTVQCVQAHLFVKDVRASQHPGRLTQRHFAETDGAGVVLAHADVRRVHDHLRQSLQYRVRCALCIYVII